MPKQIIIAEQHRIAAVFSEDQIQELIVATGSYQVGDIYLGVVENVLPAIDAAFVNLGDTERNGFIHVSDLGPVRLKRGAGAITELLSPQQKILIQVMKEPTGNKGPRLTGNISLPGRYLVLMPFGRGVNLSRRIRNENERNRLRALGILVKPSGMGLLLRTEAENVSEELIIEDLESLQKQWESVQQQASSTRAPALLGRDEDFIQRVLRDVYSADVNRIVVDSSLGLKRVKQQLLNWNAGKLPVGLLIDHHSDSPPILEYFRVNAAIREALKPRVDLPSGGYIVIERTEALTVIDVNSGSFTRSATARETVLWTNSEAATEIARQLRLRNIAGVIIVDFIDMDSRRDQLQVLEQFNKSLKADKARPQIAQLSELGLVELTRKRQGQNIYELFGRSCPTCGGLGHLVHLPGESQTALGDAFERISSRSDSSRNDSGRSDSGRSDFSRNEGRGEVGRSDRHDNNRFESRNNNEARSNDFNNVRPRFAEPTEVRGDEFSFAGEENNQELDLLNHPSYQERGGGRRRGRQQRSREPLPKVNRMPIPAQPIPPQPEPVFGMAGIPALVTPAPESDGLDRRANRRHSPRGKQEPPELVTVTMIAEEQQIYAAMGLSPLILYSGELKNPRSAIAAVALPGSEPMPLPPLTRFSRDEFSEDSGSDFGTSRIEETAKTLAEPTSANPDRGVEFSAGVTLSERAETQSPNFDFNDVFPLDRGGRDTTDSVLTDDESRVANVIQFDSAPAAGDPGESGWGESANLTLAMPDSETDTADDATGPRRRRRRSSAANSEQLSLET
jgi:ribonuclease E